MPNGWSETQRDRYLHKISEFNQRSLTGRCSSVLELQEGVFQGNLDYSALASELRRTGAEQLQVNISFPPVEFQDCTHENLAPLPARLHGFLSYHIPLSGNLQPVVLHLAYGVRRSDVYRAFGILAGFLVLPLLVTLWMGRAALNSEKADLAAAWFGFFRTLNYLLTASSLLWITSGLGARRVIQDWISQAALSRWSALTLDVVVLVGPAFLVYLLCMIAAYPVDARLRGARSNEREFLLRQVATIGARAVPLMFVLAVLETIRDGISASVALLLLAVVASQLLRIVQLLAMKAYPQTLTTGELRDRVFAMAASLGVKLTQVHVLPAGKGLMANAFAARNKVVIFTDYLLQKLTKREVETVAAHELAHLRHNHPIKRAMAFYAALFLPLYFGQISGLFSGLAIPLGLVTRFYGSPSVYLRWMSILFAFEQWSQRDLVLVLLGLTGFYMLSRRFEYSADATALLVARDPEAQITALLKISRLNFTPIHWGRASGSWSTHPSMLQRVKRIAAGGGIRPERLQQLLENHAALAPGARACEAESQETHFDVPAANDPEARRSAVRQHSATQGKLWVLRLVYLLPPLLVSLLVRSVHLEGPHAVAAYVTGVVGTAVLVTLAGVWLGSVGSAARKRRLLALFEKAGIPVGRPGDVLVGFAPTEYPRIFGTQYHWDHGFLVLSQNRLQFIGERTKFALKAADIDGIALGRGGPSWWRYKRIYVSWKDAGSGREGIFNLSWLEPGSMWSQTRRLQDLYHRLQTWHLQPNAQEPVRPELANFESPANGQVTNISPKKLASLRVNLKLLAQQLPMAIAVSILLRAQLWYVCGAICGVRLIQWFPLAVYRDRPTLVSAARAGEVNSATSNERRHQSLAAGSN